MLDQPGRLMLWLRCECERLNIPTDQLDDSITVRQKIKNKTISLTMTIKRNSVYADFFYNTYGVWGTFEDQLVLCKLGD